MIKYYLIALAHGSGTFNVEDKNLEKIFTKRLIEKSTKTQEVLLTKALTILKPGNERVYSTCSILKEENEQIIEKVLKEKNAKILPINFEGKEELPLLKTNLEGTMCVMPTELYEGFFIAKIYKEK